MEYRHRESEWRMKTLVVGSVLVFVLCFMGSPVSAVSGGGWRGGVPVLVNSQVVSYSPDPVCPISYQKRAVEGFTSPQEVCLFEGRKISAGMFFADGARARFAIMYPLDQKLSVVTGACFDMTGCYYASEQDTLIVRDQVTPMKKGVKIYRHFSDRITRKGDLLGTKVTYAFENQQPDYTLDQFGIGGIGLSQNGQWLAVEYPGTGIGLLDLDTFELKQIRNGGLPYGYGFDPTEELAVSNDGRTVLVTGMNAGFSIIDVGSSCGNGTSCEIVVYTTSGFIDDFRYGTHPQFESSGGQLRLTYVNHSGGAKQVLLRAAGYAPTSELAYVALGDSFTSGEGETDDSFYIESNGICHVSRRSYPYVIGAFMTIPLNQMRNSACSGARTGDVLKEGGQLSSVEASHPSVMSVTIGGNDVGFSAKLKVCAMPGTCEWARDGAQRHQAGLEIQQLFDTLVSTYRRLRDSTPWAKVYAIGYPKIIAVNGMCDPVTSTLLDNQERQFVEEGVSYLNQVIEAASAAAKVFYIDVEESLIGRRLCDISYLPSAVNGLRIGDDIAPLKIFPMLKMIGRESFHPSPIGHELQALTIERKYGDLTQAHSCVECSSAIPDLPYYWGSSGVERQQKFVSFLKTIELSPSSKLIIRVDPHSLEPGSQVKVEIHSEVKELGTVTVDTEGGLQAEISLPSGLDEGYHTVHLYGISYDQHPVDLYEVVRYGVIEEPVPQPTSQESLGLIAQNIASVLGVSGVAIPHKDDASTSLVQTNNPHRSLFIGIAVVGVLLVCIIAVWLLFVRLLRN